MTNEEIEAQIAALQAEKQRREDAPIEAAFESIKHLDDHQLRKLKDRIDQCLKERQMKNQESASARRPTPGLDSEFLANQRQQNEQDVQRARLLEVQEQSVKRPPQNNPFRKSE